MKILAARKRTPAQTLKLTLMNAAVAVLMELALRHWMAVHDVVSVLLARGGSAPWPDVVLALMFVLLRLFVFLILPGIVARDLFLLVARVPAATSAGDRM